MILYRPINIRKPGLRSIPTKPRTAMCAAFLNMNTTVPPDAVRTEEMLNYFSFKYQSRRLIAVFGFQFLCFRLSLEQNEPVAYAAGIGT